LPRLTITNSQQFFLHLNTLARHLCDSAGMGFMEDLDFGIMAKGMLANTPWTLGWVNL
jgi:hypothetical protein